MVVPLVLVTCRLHPCHLSKFFLTRGRILGRHPDKVHNSFPPCYSQSPLHLCLEISISSNSRNLLQFLQFSYCTLSRRKEENMTENRPLSYGWFKKSTVYRNHKSKNFQGYDRNFNEIVHSWIRLLYSSAKRFLAVLVFTYTYFYSKWKEEKMEFALPK